MRKLPQETISSVVEHVESLADNPFPFGVRKLSGTEHTYRIRSGDYRIVYNVEKNLLVVEIIRVGHRRDVYRQLI